MMRNCGGKRMVLAVLACVCWAGVSWAETAVPEVAGRLRHAVVCPPFKGPPALAAVYHAEMVQLLQGAEGIELYDGSRARASRQPDFVFRVNGVVEEDAGGGASITVTVVDAARKEQVARMTSEASTNAVALAAWKEGVRENIERRAERLPFECRVQRRMGQESYTLDRGLGAGLAPGVWLYVAIDEEPILSQATGELIGRESSRTVGRIEVFRVSESSAYARPVGDTTLPRSGGLFARTF